MAIGLKKKAEVPGIVRELTQTYQDPKLMLQHLGDTPLPSEAAIIGILKKLRIVLFPGYFGREHVNPAGVEYYIGELVYEIYEQLSHEIYKAFCQQQPQQACEEAAEEVCLRFLRTLPDLRSILVLDVEAAMDGDPAARSFDEIILSYPGLAAITIYRLAHELQRLEIPLIPRMMTEFAHRKTGIDIHPGAAIGRRLFIDHGTGVVVGETTRIGNNVKIYQGVTLGALSVPKEGAVSMRGVKRHPTIQDDVVIYSGATILGGDTVIGHDSVIGGNVWIVSSVPPRSKVMLEVPKLRISVNE